MRKNFFKKLTSASLFGTTPRVTGPSWTHSGLTERKRRIKSRLAFEKKPKLASMNPQESNYFKKAIEEEDFYIRRLYVDVL